MKGKDLLLLGGLAIGAYLVYKYVSGSKNGGGSTIWDYGGSGGGTDQGGGCSGGSCGDLSPNVPDLPPTITGQPTYNIDTPVTTYVNKAGFPVTARVQPMAFTPIGTPIFASQAWTKTTYGSVGQPSQTFAVRTVQQGSTKFSTPVQKAAKAAVFAGAPPRIVAKIKAGKVW